MRCVSERDDDAGLGGRLSLPELRLSPVGSVLVRVAIAFFAIAATTMLVYVQRSQYQDNTGTPVDFVDALYFATVSLSTTGYGDITPATDQARLVNIFLITPLRVLFLIVLVGSALEVLTARTRNEFRERRWRKKLKDHTVVIGYGVKGRSAVRMLLDNDIEPERIVVIANDAAAVEDATRPTRKDPLDPDSDEYPGVAGILGDARREEVLTHADVPTAGKVIVAVDRDDVAVLVTLAVRKLAPRTKLVAAAREQASANVLKQSGADQVITTAEAAGRLLGMQLVHPIAGELMEDLLDPSEGLEVREREVGRAELGLSPAQLSEAGEMLLAVQRGDHLYRFDTDALRVLQKGDRIVTIRQGQKHPRRSEFSDD
ncbi:MAG: potassium channel family protein [Actinobacteria bacterium]|nr:potassium channel family protein [Micrococcales bacterium]MCB0903762.1 potassium channel family protein [Actinomycetota bacterium]MCB9429690.1 potassium channel family protein [Actinomycetota bacterium]